MQRFSGFSEKGYRFEVQVPTTIFDNLAATITAYDGEEKLRSMNIPLRKMPSWNIPCQCIDLGKKDMSTLEKRTKEFVKQLPEHPDYMR